MSKIKGLVLDSTPRYGVGEYEDAKARLRHQSLMQDYEELQREADAMRSKLEAANQRKSILAAEVRFLRKRYKYLVETKNMNPSQEHLAHPPNLLKKTKITKEPIFTGKEASRQRRLPLVPEPKKKKHNIVEQVTVHDAMLLTNQAPMNILYGGKEASKRSSTQVSTPLSGLNRKGKIRNKKEAVASKTSIVMTPMLDNNPSGRMFSANNAALSNSTAAFDLNLDGGPSGKEASLRSRPPTFDLNEISTGDEDFQSQINLEAVKMEEARKSFTRGIINDEQQNDLKLAVCRNSGEGSSRVGKRKISWQDPVALRV